MDRFAVFSCLPFLDPIDNTENNDDLGESGKDVVEWVGWARLHVTEEMVGATVDAPNAHTAAHPAFSPSGPRGELDSELTSAAVRVDVKSGRVSLQLDGITYRLSLRAAGRVLCCSLVPADFSDGLLGGTPPPACLLDVPRESSSMPFASVLFQECGINFVGAAPRVRQATTGVGNPTRASTTSCRVNGIQVPGSNDQGVGVDELSVRVLATAIAGALEHEMARTPSADATRPIATASDAATGRASAAGVGADAEDVERRYWAAAAVLADAVVDGEHLEHLSTLVANVGVHRKAIVGAQPVRGA